MKSLEQFRSLLIDADIIDDRYDATGSFVWLPYGLKLRNRICNLLRGRFGAEGYDEYEFPILIPKSYLRRQEEATMSFEDSVCWVDRFGTEELKEPYFLRPTGEAQVYPMVKRWLRSYRELPLRMLLIQPMFRAFRGGTPLLSGQGAQFIEGHSIHADRASAETDFEAAIEYISSALSLVGLEEHLIVQRPQWGNLPVSERTIGFDVATPLEQTVMPASLYMQGEIYAGPYGLDYRDENNETRTPSTIAWGLSTRVLGLSLMLTADERGLRVLPDLSPIEIVFVTISGSKAELKHAETLEQILPFRTKIDAGTGAVGRRFDKWERRGVPLRVEVGPDEVDGDTVTVYRRDTNERTEIRTNTANSFRDRIGDLLEESSENLREASKATHKDQIQAVDNVREIRVCTSDGGIAKFNHCESKECGRAIEEAIDGEILGWDIQKNSNEPCAGCSSEADTVAYASRRF